MKTISKLFTTSALLLVGALVSFGADMNTTPAMTKPANAGMMAKLSDSDYRELVGKMTVGEFVEAVKNKLQDRQKDGSFLMMIKEKNPELKAKIEAFVKENKDKQLKDLDTTKIKEFFENIVSKTREHIEAKKKTADASMINDKKKASYYDKSKSSY